MSEILLLLILLTMIYSVFVKGSRWERKIIIRLDDWERRRAAKKRGEMP